MQISKRVQHVTHYSREKFRPHQFKQLSVVSPGKAHEEPSIQAHTFRARIRAGKKCERTGRHLGGALCAGKKCSAQAAANSGRSSAGVVRGQESERTGGGPSCAVN